MCFCILHFKRTLSHHFLNLGNHNTTHKQQKTNYSLQTGEKTYRIILRKTPTVSKSIFNYATLRAQAWAKHIN